MALAARIIPRIDIKGPNVVKGMHLEGLRVLGKPEDFAKYYYDSGADELIFQDVVASLYGRNSLHDIIQKVAKEISIPLTVGGGIRSLENIKEILRSGADKVAINTAALENPDLIKKASKQYGKSTIVVGIEAIKQSDGGYLAYSDNGRNHSGKAVIDWAKEVEELGAGEILLTSVDNEGVGKGIDEELIGQLTKEVSIPVIAHGGVGKAEHVESALRLERLNAIAIASMFHYEYIIHNRDSEKIKEEGNVDFLKGSRNLSLIDPTSIPDLKNFLIERDICCRLKVD